MLSSTFSSNAANAAWGIRALVGSLVLVGLALEVGARVGVPLINQNQRRMGQEYRSAMHLGRDPARDRVPVLLLGNSLTLTDFDMPQLQSLLGPRVQVARWAIDDTNYLDWYFALRHLFRKGARPQVVVIGGRANHLLASHVRGNYFAHYLLHWTDLLVAADRTGTDATGTSDMSFANASAFYGGRQEINKRLLKAVLPDFPDLASVFAGKRQRGPTDEVVLRDAPGRLSEFKALCAAHGARLIVWIAPSPSGDPNAAVGQAGKRVGVEVLIPRPGERILPERFSDGLHLDPVGARQWTVAMARRLRPLLLTGKSTRTDDRPVSEREGVPSKESLPGPSNLPTRGRTRADAHSRLGADSEVTFEVVDRIPRGPNGKFRAVVEMTEDGTGESRLAG
jgi:hypothetical protein